MEPKLTKNYLLTIFTEEFSFWGPYRRSKKFSCAPLNKSHQDTSFKYTYDFILSEKFFHQKIGKIGRNSKILPKSS